MFTHVMFSSISYFCCLVDAMMTIKTEYQVKKNWMGDPCLPENYVWIGLTCRSDGVTSRVISL